jgi:formylglycine-generating enzyme
MTSHRSPNFPKHFPPLWASAYGDDTFGLWAELEIADIVQRMRWIEPGEFLMGSPESEVGRRANEGPQHRVKITEGFWLADSACSQAFWLAVVGGENPSRFKEDLNCPVERVSFDDVAEFLSQLQTLLLEECMATLPTEAQWEYACRAGTQTPFYFGTYITPEHVSYNGKRGRYRERTVPVKSLPPNVWGLYEMHGNVYEWCADDLRDYRALKAGQAELDPQGSYQSSARALRGGSWFDLARLARAAYRNHFGRGHRFNVGFRLFLRSHVRRT